MTVPISFTATVTFNVTLKLMSLILLMSLQCHYHRGMCVSDMSLSLTLLLSLPLMHIRMSTPLPQVETAHYRGKMSTELVKLTENQIRSIDHFKTSLI